MNKTAKTILWVVIIVIVIGAIWYGVTRKPTTEEVIKIGAILPLTGKNASYGERTQRGIELALEEVNKEEKIIEVIYEDSRGDLKEAASAAQKLINIDKVQVLFSQLSGVSQAIAPIAQENKIILFGFTSTPGFTKQGDYIFSNRGDATNIGKRLGEFAIEKEYKKAAIVYLNNETHKGIEEGFREIFENNDRSVVISELHEKTETDFRTILTKIKAAQPQVILFSSRDKYVAMMLVQARELGLDQQVLSVQGIDSKSFLEIAQHTAEGIIYAQTIVYEDITNPELQETLKEHQNRYGEPMSLYAANSYDVVKLLAKIVKTGIKTSPAIKIALLETRDFPGISGDITFDETGNVHKENKLFTVKNGQFVPYEE